MIVKIMSIFLASTLFINSTMMYVKPFNTKVESNDEQVIETVIDIPENNVVVNNESEVKESTDISEVSKVETVVSEPEKVEESFIFTEEEIDLIALVTMAEAEGEPEEGKRLVIDVILNRYDSPRFPNTINGVIYAKNAFECMWNGRVDRCYVRDDIRQLVLEEIESRTNDHIHYFRMSHYHNFGKPVVQVGNHYFSTY